MKVEVEAVDPVRRRLAIEVPAEEVRDEIERAYADLGRRARVRGFRPGRTPRPVLEQLFGDQVRAEVFGKLIQRSYAEALQGQDLAVVSEPQIVTEQAEPGAALRYSATVEVKPEVVARDYSGFRVERTLVLITEAEVGAVLQRLQDSLAQLLPITERTRVARGDVVTLDYEARREQRLVGRGENRLVEIGRGQFSQSFDEQLEDAEVGTTREFSVAYPADYSNAELAGQTIDFRVTVKALAQREVPALDDDFAKDHGECETLAALRERVRQRLEAQAALRADQEVRAKLIDQLLAAHGIAVPDVMVQRRALALAEEVINSMRDVRLRQRDAAAERERLAAELVPQARKQVQTALLLEAIARQEHLEVSDDEVRAQIDEMAAPAGTGGERVRAQYQDEGMRAGLHARMLQQRALELVASRATITTTTHASVVADSGQNG
ncbi:MAG: trigger factor [Deltaproteobacteria bacterium]|nr:trigger factor [Deltaproteobacteria bacterium]